MKITMLFHKFEKDVLKNPYKSIKTTMLTCPATLVNLCTAMILQTFLPKNFKCNSVCRNYENQQLISQNHVNLSENEKFEPFWAGRGVYQQYSCVEIHQTLVAKVLQKFTVYTTSNSIIKLNPTLGITLSQRKEETNKPEQPNIAQRNHLHKLVTPITFQVNQL